MQAQHKERVLVCEGLQKKPLQWVSVERLGIIFAYVKLMSELMTSYDAAFVFKCFPNGPHDLDPRKKLEMATCLVRT